MKSLIVKWEKVIKIILVISIASHTIWGIAHASIITKFSSDVYRSSLVLDMYTAFEDDDLDKDKLQATYKGRFYNSSIEEYVDESIMNSDIEGVRDEIIQEITRESNKIITAIQLYMFNLVMCLIVLGIVEYAVSKEEKRKLEEIKIEYEKKYYVTEPSIEGNEILEGNNEQDMDSYEESITVISDISTEGDYN